MNGNDILRSCPWMLEARRLIGAKEIQGPAHNSAIVRMWESIKAPFRDDETPWCAAYVGHCLEAANVRSTRSAAARSYVNWGSPWVGGLKAYGSIIVLSRPGSRWSGHVGFLTGFDADRDVLQLLSGNSDNQVKFAEYPLDRMVAARWPSEAIPENLLRCPPFISRARFARSDA